MVYHPDLIIVLWLLPFTFLLVLPLVLATIALFLLLTRRYFFTGNMMGKEQRRHPRFIPYDGTFAEVSIGEMRCTGMVNDISRLGIGLKYLPDKLLEKMDRLTVVIRGYGVDHNLLVRPKWVLRTEAGKQIGAEIDTMPPGWIQFLLQTKRISQPEQ